MQHQMQFEFEGKNDMIFDCNNIYFDTHFELFKKFNDAGLIK